MSKDNTIYDLIRAECDTFSLHLESDTSDSKIRIFTDNATGLTLCISLDGPSKFSFYYLVRTYDVVYNGDRSDIHVVISLMFSSFLRVINDPISCSLFDIPHPVIEDEIWGRYIIPEQLQSLTRLSTINERNEKIIDLIRIMVFWRDMFWNYVGCPCENCMKELEDINYRQYDLCEKMDYALNENFPSSESLNYGKRLRPNMEYVYDMDNEVTIIKSKELSFYLQTILNPEKRDYTNIKGVKGTLYIENSIKNFLKDKAKKELKQVFNSLLESKKNVDYLFVPLENMIIAQANDYIIALGRLCGIREFKKEREKIRERHNIESELLFPIPSFEWIQNPCSSQFEKLIWSLLEREPNIISVKTPAPTNQADKGRDLIIQWKVQDANILSTHTPPISTIKVVGQCKASNATIGKNKVLDIRDTIETHNSQGFFLAVSTQISAPLTEKLEQLQSNGIWTNWWNREEIESRLKKHQDLIPLFPKVLNVKHKIKFVDQQDS